MTPIFSLQIAHLPWTKSYRLIPYQSQNMSMKMSQPTWSEMHSKQPFHRLENLRVTDIPLHWIWANNPFHGPYFWTQDLDPKLEVWFLKLAEVFFWVGSPKNQQKCSATLAPLPFLFILYKSQTPKREKTWQTWEFKLNQPTCRKTLTIGCHPFPHAFNSDPSVNSLGPDFCTQPIGLLEFIVSLVLGS